MELPDGRLARISEEEWRTIVLELAVYAKWVIRRRRLREAPESLASEAIKRVLTGARSCLNYNSIFDCLKGVVDSICSHIAGSPEHTRKKPLHANILDKSKMHIGIPHETVSLAQAVERCAEGDPFLRDIVNCLKLGLKAREIAAELRVPVREVYQGVRKLKRRVKSAGLIL